MLYYGIQSTGKPAQEIVMMDYGAGLGTLYLLAKMIGVKTIIYNDLMPGFAEPAIKVDQALGIVMDHYIIGDVKATCKYLQEHQLLCDLILSRNVLEHIYKLDEFFSTIHTYQPQAILYNSTTANSANPLTQIQHYMIHKRALKMWTPEKAEWIQKQYPQINSSQAMLLAHKLKAVAVPDLNQYCETYLKEGKLGALPTEGSNVVNVDGLWAEHLISLDRYKKYAPQYEVIRKPGIWDVDYDSAGKRWVGKVMQVFTNIFGAHAASFIYIICHPRK
jgi:2-polyprenyl-3-methyl-5-hydroxy-6-metoxy-1,4-benzoquinol methylase